MTGITLLLLLFLQTSLGNSTTAAPNNIPNPSLILIRDPAVHADLKLTPLQRQQVQTLTDQLDIPMWKMRGMQQESGFTELHRLISITNTQLEQILTPPQINRFHQIVLRAQRLEGLFRDDIAKVLNITTQQQSDLRTIIDAVQKELTELNSRKSHGEQAKVIQIEMAAVNQKANDRLKEILSNQQRVEWSKLLGPEFDLNKLGDVRYKAPEFATETEWLHSPPLQLSSLRGKVVVIHYMAYG